MKHTTQTEFGRPIEAVLSQPEDMMVDKWDALKALTQAADNFDIGHRTLGVLKALMTFLPDRLITPAPRSAIVFPSNKTLSDRLNGMPDSTLRRHLARLVELGIVSRHNSANRKRFARRNGQGALMAFGFDLSPIAHHFATLKQAAQDAIKAHEATMALRAELAHLRQGILHIPTLAEAARQVLRRKPNAAAIREMIALITKELSSTDAQNERHIEDVIISNSDSLALVANEPPLKKTNALEASARQNAQVTLNEVLINCREYKSYFPQPVHQWTDLIAIADRLTGMIGIDTPVFKEAMAKMGARKAATVVLCILDRFDEIDNAGGYLRRLSQNDGVSDAALRRMMRIAS